MLRSSFQGPHLPSPAKPRLIFDFARNLLRLAIPGLRKDQGKTTGQAVISSALTCNFRMDCKKNGACIITIATNVLPALRLLKNVALSFRIPLWAAFLRPTCWPGLCRCSIAQ